MIIPVVMDENKDRELINWLSSKNNRSAFIRYVLYVKMEGNVVKIDKNNQISEEIEDNLLSCIEGLSG
jgi:predicted ribosome quality control (RQC) complex YloA/Tae2 family protein